MAAIVAKMRGYLPEKILRRSNIVAEENPKHTLQQAANTTCKYADFDAAYFVGFLVMT